MTADPRITILAPHYWPETNAAGRRLHAAAEHFRDSGWLVTVITPAPHHPENRVHDGYGGSRRSDANENGIRVIRFAPLIVPSGNLLLRLVSELLFSTKAGMQALLTKPDFVLASTPYMFLGPTGLLASRVMRAKFAWDVRDLTWQYVKATGKRTFGLDRLLEKLMLFTAARADVLTTATDSQLVQLSSRSRGRSAVITNGLTEEFMAELRRGQAREPDGRFTVVYAGLLGMPQGLETLVRAAALMPSARFMLAGDGPDGGHLRELVEQEGLKNVEFLGHIASSALPDLYASADVLVAMLKGSDAFKVAQPSKVWEYMATGKPVLFAGDCEATDIIAERDIGVVTLPEDPQALAAALEALASDAGERRRLGERGQEFVMAERNRTVILERWEQLLRG